MSSAGVWVVAMFFAGVGVFGLVAPAKLIRPFGMIADRVESRSELRAVYGGFGLAMAGVLLLASQDVAGCRRGALMATGAALAGMAVGRLVSRAVDGPQPWYPIWFYTVVEILGAAILFASL